MTQLTLTLKMTTAQAVETSVTVKNNSPIQDYVHPDDHTQPSYDQFLIDQNFLDTDSFLSTRIISIKKQLIPLLLKFVFTYLLHLVSYRDPFSFT